MRSGSLEIRLGEHLPVIVSYRALPDGPRLQGGAELDVTILDLGSGDYRQAKLKLASASTDQTETSFDLDVMVDDLPVAEIRLRYALDEMALSISSEILSESQGFHVGSVILKLLQVGGEAGASLVLPTRSGRLVDLRVAKPEKATHKVDWFEPAPVAMAFHDQMLGVLTLDTVDCQLIHEVEGQAGSISVELLHRHRVDRPKLSFLAQRIASCKLRIVAASDGKKVDWTQGAALVRDDVRPNLSDLYVGALIYKVILQFAGSDEMTTYSDVLDLIRRVSRLTANARQIVYLVGWQHGGHDTGYPDVYTANPRVGSFADFRALKEAAVAENAIVSLHDNYHDTYMDSPAWDPSIVCIERSGELRKGGIWGGGRQAYEIGPTKYAPRAEPRIEWTVRTLDLKQTTHLDVLSDKPDMVDCDPKGPASREQNALAKRDIVEMFRRKGVDVTSEVLTSPFVPFMHHFWHVERRPIEGWSATERIPLIPFIYHGKVTAGGDATTDAGKLDQIEYGWTFSADWSKSTPDSEILEEHYLVGIPWSLLATREVSGFTRDGDWEKVSYDDETYVRVNRVLSNYEIVVDGMLIAKDFATFAPIGEGIWVVFSRSGGTIRISAGKQSKVTALVGDELPDVHWDGKLTFEARPGVPYRVHP